MPFHITQTSTLYGSRNTEDQLWEGDGHSGEEAGLRAWETPGGSHGGSAASQPLAAL